MSMTSTQQRSLFFFGIGLAVPSALLTWWMSSANMELANASSTSAAHDVELASVAEEGYCSAKLKQVLRRVAGACGLLEGARGCRPGDAKTVAALSGADFNMLFQPLSDRAGIIQFDAEQVELDAEAQALVEERWSAKRGASFFFVVARASADGNAAYNQTLSQQRAEGVLTHLETKFQDPEIRSEVGLLWLGEEYAQLDEKFCEWRRSRSDACTQKDINRSAFVAWIDCAI
ncbi:MAG: hypothetical protein IPK13_01360 [Deltaproteobacteria bacterium]|nr:hypothetical protein [Deltaproteobacteria bacterium]